jgi:hypothetical protein
VKTPHALKLTSTNTGIQPHDSNDVYEENSGRFGRSFTYAIHIIDLGRLGADTT